MLANRTPQCDEERDYLVALSEKPSGFAVLSSKDMLPALSACQTVAELRNWLLKFGRSLGFYGGRYTQLGRSCWGMSEMDSLQPIRFLSTSSHADREDKKWICADPSISRVRSAFAPFVWSTKLGQDVTAAQRAWLDDERARGVDAGLTIPVQDSDGCPAYLSLFGVDEAAVLLLIEERAPELAFAGAQFHAIAKSLVPPARWMGHAPRLSNREIECLKLAALGQNVNESGQTLGISGRTVEFHLRNALDKLGAPTKIRAVVLAFGGGMGGALA